MVNIDCGQPIAPKFWNDPICLIQLLPYGFHGLLSQICFENRTHGHRINTDNPAKWSQTYLLAEVAHQDIVASRHFQLTCTNYAFSLASVVLLLRAHLPTLAHDATMVRLWMHQPKKILNTTDICLTAARGQMRAELMRTRGFRALPTCAASRNRPIALPGELVCGRL